MWVMTGVNLVLGSLGGTYRLRRMYSCMGGHAADDVGCVSARGVLPGGNNVDRSAVVPPKAAARCGVKSVLVSGVQPCFRGV